MPHLSQARLLGYTPFPHRAFQGHAAHLAERPATLSPNGSPPPWQKGRSDEVTFFHAFHGTVCTAHESIPLLRAWEASRNVALAPEARKRFRRRLALSKEMRAIATSLEGKGSYLATRIA